MLLEQLVTQASKNRIEYAIIKYVTFLESENNK
jgi:hypothetical protein